MKAIEVIPDLESRELITAPKIRTVDRYGRLSIGTDLAGEKVLVLVIKLKEGDIGPFQDK